MWIRACTLLLLAALAMPATAVPDTMAQRAKACTGCHGPQGRSRPDGYVPRLAGKPAGYLYAQLRAFREGRRRHEIMAQLLENLDDAMLRELADHFAAMQLPYPRPTTTLPAAGDAQRAQTLVHQGDAARELPACAACHGTALTGIAPAVPGLLGLPPDYINAQLGAWRTGQRRAPAPDCMARIAQRLPLEDVARVARWLAAQPLPADTRASTVAPPRWPLQCASVAR